MADLPNHFFKFIRPGFKFNFSIPRSFWTNLKGVQCKTSILRRGRRQWLVEISEGGVFGEGWRELVSYNGVQEFDFIVFKHQGNMVFDFMVFDQTSCERQYPNLCDEPITESDPIYTHRKVRSTPNEEDDLPYFIGEVKSYSMRMSIMYMPIEFARRNELINKEEMILINVKDESSWTVKLKKCMNRYYYIGQGWKEFRVANGLKEGDRFKLELINNGEKPIANFFF